MRDVDAIPAAAARRPFLNPPPARRDGELKRIANECLLRSNYNSPWTEQRRHHDRQPGSEIQNNTMRIL